MTDSIIYCSKEYQYLPDYQTDGSAGGDLRADASYFIAPHATAKIDTGLKACIPEGYAMIIKPRSSLAIKKGLLVIDGTIDSDYRGNISIVVHNLTDDIVSITDGERIAQGIIIKVHKLNCKIDLEHYDTFEQIYPTERGTGGFGSTGSN